MRYKGGRAGGRRWMEEGEKEVNLLRASNSIFHFALIARLQESVREPRSYFLPRRPLTADAKNSFLPSLRPAHIYI